MLDSKKVKEGGRGESCAVDRLEGERWVVVGAKGEIEGEREDYKFRDKIGFRNRPI